MEKTDLFAHVDREADHLRDLAGQLWANPELGLDEHDSSRALMDALEAEGFEVEAGVGGMPTAFVAAYGDGGPRVGVLGEYDALPGLSQRVAAEPDPVVEGDPGHGCGHNLFGVACLGGAVAAKRAVEAGAVDGTVVYYGCPAEETLVGKVFMARAGVFDGLDAAVTWHPGDLATPQRSSSLALDSVVYEFDGVAAHAAASPESGRSALDAVQLLNTGVEYVREHVSEEARIHYSIREGGDAPNVVPASASVWYYVRAPTRNEVESITDWLDDVAEGAALMTQTGMDKRVVTGCYEFLPNGAVTDVVWENLQAVGPVEFADDERAFAADLQATFDDGAVGSRVEDVPEEHADAVAESALYGEPVPAFDEGEVGSGSTDVGDVSWITPTAQFRAPTWPVGTPAHSWQAVAADGDFGERGMLAAAKAIAGSVFDLLDDPETLAAAREEFDAATGEAGYESPLPEDADPPFGMTG